MGGKLRQLRIILFGLGRIGRTHFHSLIQNQEVELVNVVEYDCEVAKNYIKEYSPSLDIPVTDLKDVDTIYNDDSIDAVVVATPTPTHEDIIMKALGKGKHVFCEKPLSLSIKAVAACYKLADEKGLTLYCGFNRRHDASFSKLRDRLISGDIGRLQKIRLVLRDPAPPPVEYMKVAGHLFQDCVIHAIDLSLWLTGSFPTKVYAVGSVQFEETRQHNDIDSTTTVLSFPNDVTVTLDAARSTTYGNDQRIEAFGMGGMLIADNKRYTSVEMYNDKGSIRDHMYYFCDRFAQAYQTEIEDFVKIIRGKSPISVTGEQVINGLKVADACWKSVKSGNAVEIDYN